jgi:hypothetical protein
VAKKKATKKKAPKRAAKKKSSKPVAKKTAPKKAAKKAPKKKTAKKKTKRGNADVGKRPVGKTTMVGVQATWVWVFERNEKAKKRDKWTDERISEFMKSEFPGRESAVFDRIQAMRFKYNAGGMTGGVQPKVQSNRYDGDGEIIVVKRGPGGGARSADRVTVKVRKMGKAGKSKSQKSATKSAPKKSAPGAKAIKAAAPKKSTGKLKVPVRKRK